MKSQKESQLIWGQQQEITIIKPEVGSTWCLCKETQGEAAQLETGKRDAIFMNLGQRERVFCYCMENSELAQCTLPREVSLCAALKFLCVW